MMDISFDHFPDTTKTHTHVVSILAHIEMVEKYAFLAKT